MADETVTDPLIATPAVAPDATATPLASAAPERLPDAPAATPIPEPGSADPEPAAKLHTDTPDLLDAKPPEPKPGETKPETKPDAPAEPVAAAEPVAEAIKYEFKFPETVKPQPEQVEALTALLRGAKVDPETAQKLVDLHGATVEQFSKETLARQHQQFGDMRAEWRGRIQADPVLGGAGFETVQRAVMDTVRMFVPEADRKEFNEMRQVTGVGDHPAFWRFVHNVARALRQPVPVQPGSPPPDIGKSPKRSIKDFYASTAA